MYNEKAPSLFLPKLAAILFTVIFLSGVIEVACLATTAQKSNYSIVRETSRLIPQPSKTHAPTTQINNQVSIN